jgi:tetratricopeptide (TPR) repeat protein
MRFLFLIMSFCLAADPATTAVEHAQSLVLKKNRHEACAVLQNALEAGSLNNSGKQKVRDSLNSISKMFFTDKGQRLFENGQTALFENPDVATTQFRGALQLEDSNILILNGLAKIHLAKKDCEGALGFVEQARILNPWFPETSVLEMRTLICQKRFAAAREKGRTMPPLDKWNEAFVQYLSAQNLMEENLPRKAFELLSKVSEEFPKFPESYYFLAKAGGELSKDTEPWLQKYASLCKALTPRDRKSFSEEPQLCAHLKDVEDELQKKTATE